MATTLILSLAIALALAMLLVPAIGTVVFAQNMSGTAGNMTSNMSGTAGNMTGAPPG
jgi:Cu/Ag efflux pump CusA